MPAAQAVLPTAAASLALSGSAQARPPQPAPTPHLRGQLMSSEVQLLPSHWDCLCRHNAVLSPTTAWESTVLPALNCASWRRTWQAQQGKKDPCPGCSPTLKIQKNSCLATYPRPLGNMQTHLKQSIPGLGLALAASGGCMRKCAVAAVAAGSSAAGVTDVD